MLSGIYLIFTGSAGIIVLNEIIYQKSTSKHKNIVHTCTCAHPKINKQAAHESLVYYVLRGECVIHPNLRWDYVQNL